ncbi:hypothetical protein [Sulfurimonas sp.]|uniref:hypothetical protein n=1 Tax=Sulfurimonas sp. TaxID=2022749 RepID=UPI003D0A6F08
MYKPVSTLGVLVFVGNLTLSAVVFTDVKAPVREERQRVQSIDERIKQHLSSRGLETQNLEFDLKTNSVQSIETVNFLSQQLQVSQERVIEVLSNQILQKKYVNLNSADTLIALAYKIKAEIALPQQTLDAIHQFVA